jgi:hypothetical protein
MKVKIGPLECGNHVHDIEPTLGSGLGMIVYMYGVVARLAMLASSYEMEATDPEAELDD